MDKQKIFLMIIAAGAIFILILQNSQIPNGRYLNKSYSQYDGAEGNDKPDKHDFDDKQTNDISKSVSKWHYNKLVHELSKAISDSDLDKSKRKAKLQKAWSSRFNFIKKFRLYEGDKQSKILILAYFRSGSSFVGDLLQQNWKSFYTFEPLHYMTRQTRIGDSNITEATNLISDIFNCDFSKDSSYINWIQNNTFLIRWNRFFWNICKFRSLSLCYDDNFLSQVCVRSKYNIIKSVRLKVRDLEQLYEKLKVTNLKVIYLVRDPRGIYNSRKAMEWCNSDECSNLTSICSELRQDLLDYDRLRMTLGNDLVIARYEDISSDPLQQAKQLFKSINLEFSPSVQRFLRTHTNSYAKEKDKDKKNPYSTYRANSTSTAIQWTKELNSSELQYAQQVCKDVLERLNYTLLSS